MVNNRSRSGDTDGLLFGALSRLVERASKNPSGLLDRLQELVRATKDGQLRLAVKLRRRTAPNRSLPGPVGRRLLELRVRTKGNRPNRNPTGMEVNGMFCVLNLLVGMVA